MTLWLGMDWANDQFGKIVHAAEKRLFRYGFTCPECGERVRLRAGKERRPHFAHYGHSPKPDCENYHPSPHERLKTLTGFQREVSVAFDGFSFRGGVYLEGGEDGRFLLYLKLPRIKPEVDISGEVCIQTALGVRTYSAFQLRRSLFVRVSPQVPLVEVSGQDEMRDAVGAILEDASYFQVTGNIFRANGDSGRLLAPSEPLEWGETYRILTQHSLPLEIGCELVAQSMGKGWLLYEVRMPNAPEEEELENPLRKLVFRFLGRAINRQNARAYLIDPIPHHIEPDGTYIYPYPPKRLLLRRTIINEIHIEGSGCGLATEIKDHGSEWVEIIGLIQGEATITCNAQIQVSIRIENCEPFRPQGVHVSVGDQNFDLFDNNLRNALKEHWAGIVEIHAQSTRIADAIQVEKSRWTRRGLQYSLNDGALCPVIEAGNFGAITWRELKKPADSIESHVSAEMASKRAWIEGMVMRMAGHDALLQLKKSWMQGYLKFPPVFSGRNAWIRPHIDAVMKK